MKLRNLELKDAPHMLEWMHDNDVIRDLGGAFTNKKIEDCEKFISLSAIDKNNVHLAIASDEDEYMGTASLKNIDRSNNSAEISIVIRKFAMGKGYAWFGIEEIIKEAFEKYDLEVVYWCISRKNERAIKFCEKHIFHEAVDILPSILNRYDDNENLKWYSVLKGDVLDNRNSVAGCRIVHIKTIPTVDAGELSFFESGFDVSFDFKRMYYISKVPEGTRRGFHAHKKLKQLLFCPYGRIQLILENKHGKEEIELSDPSIGITIEEPTWREMLWIQKDSVLCVAASDYYDANDYIRDYREFKANYIV